MNARSYTVNILLCSDNPTLEDLTLSAMPQEYPLQLKTIMHIPIQRLPQIINDRQPNVILLDFKIQPQPFFIVTEIHALYPYIKVIALLPESKANLADRALQAGASAAIVYPYSPGSLEAELYNLLDLENFAVDSINFIPDVEQNSTQKTYSIFSTKGGVGCTSLAINLAINLHNSTKKEVLLIEGKQLFGHVSLYLNLLTANSIIDLATNADMLDHQLVKQVVVSHKSGISVLPGPKKTDETNNFSAQSLFNILERLKEMYPYIVIDVGNSLNEYSVTYLDTSNKVLFVLTPDLASMHNAKQFIEVSETLEYPDEKIHFILNMTGRKSEIKSKEIENSLNVKFLGKIPLDENIMLTSLNEGTPIMLKKPQHAICKEINEISNRLANEE